MGIDSNAYMIFGFSYDVEIEDVEDASGEEVEIETLVLSDGTRIVRSEWPEPQFTNPLFESQDCEDLSNGLPAERGAFGFVRRLDCYEVPEFNFEPEAGWVDALAEFHPGLKPGWHFVHSRS
jgi:hypothetical protein